MITSSCMSMTYTILYIPCWKKLPSMAVYHHHSRCLRCQSVYMYADDCSAEIYIMRDGCIDLNEYNMHNMYISFDGVHSAWGSYCTGVKTFNTDRVLSAIYTESFVMMLFIGAREVNSYTINCHCVFSLTIIIQWSSSAVEFKICKWKSRLLTTVTYCENDCQVY